MPQPFEFNPLDPETRRNPWEIYTRGREAGIVRHEGLPIRLVSVFRFEDCQAILRDDSTWSSRFRDEDFFDRPELADLDEPPPSMLGTDGAEHHRLRSLVNKAFSPRIVQRLEPRLHELSRQLVDAAVEAGEVDLVQALTYPLPVTMIAEIIGVPAEDREMFKSWSDKVIAALGTGFFGGIDIEAVRRQRLLLKQMRDYFVPLAEERERNPQEDLLTGLVQARHEGSRLSHDEMLSMLTLILVAGNETTTTLIGNAVLALIDHPDELARLRSDPSLLPTAVEEVVRFSSPVQFDPRRAARDLELHGEKIERHDFVLCWLGSANRDPEAFDDADRFDVGRPKSHHLGFGFGVHYCLGANLARLEAQVALQHLLERTRHIELASNDPLPLHPSPVFRGVTSLPVRLRGRS